MKILLVAENSFIFKRLKKMIDEKYNIMKNVFGFSKFRPGQEIIINSLVSGVDVLAVMPTGFGKSLCYYMSAIILDGLTLVVSPLISLMKDQVDFLKKHSIKAEYINSELTSGNCRKILNNAINSKYKILYVAPERLTTKIFLDASKKLNIAMVVVDEAHCVSRWGHDFRPSYLHMLKFFELLKKRPVIACFTATATYKVREDIIKSLKLKSPFIKVGGFDRPNLFLDVIAVEEKNKLVKLLAMLKKIKDENIIIYCSTRSKVDIIYDILKSKKYKVARYHAGLRGIQRKRSQEDFLNGVVNILVATNAFGMGVDKKDIRFLIHYNMPQNLESYYQEVGRAGRDGKFSRCIMFQSEYDIELNKFFIENLKNTVEDKKELEFVIKRNYYCLDEIIRYCRYTGCYRKYILKYFGEEMGDCNNCGNCSNKGKTKGLIYDILYFFGRKLKNES